MAKARVITGLDPQAPGGRNARIMVRERLADMYSYARYATSPDNTQGLHDLRIAAKRVRYTLEVFEEFLPEASQGFVEELAKLQDELGALHDSEVMLALLRLSLDEAGTERSETRRSTKSKALLSPEMASNILDPARTSALSEKGRQGLASFLRKQEQRRAQAYASFHQHWEELEQRHFRAELLAMLEQNKRDEETSETSSPQK